MNKFKRVLTSIALSSLMLSQGANIYATTNASKVDSLQAGTTEYYANMDFASASKEMRAKIIEARREIIYTKSWGTRGAQTGLVNIKTGDVEILPMLEDLYPEWDIEPLITTNDRFVEDYINYYDTFPKNVNKDTSIKEEKSSIDVIIKGNHLNMDVDPILKDNKVYIGIRDFAEALDFKVDWMKGQNRVKLSNLETTILITIGQKEVSVNGKNINLDEKSFVEKGRTFIPLRSVAEVLSQEVKWDQEKRTAVIGESIE